MLSLRRTKLPACAALPRALGSSNPKGSADCFSEGRGHTVVHFCPLNRLVSGAGDIKLTKDGNVLLHEMGLHPRIITEGFEAAKEKALQFLEQVKVSKEMDIETLIDVARTSLRTKVHAELADVLTEAVVDSILAIKKQDEPIDLFMVEIMEMKHKSETDTSLIRGLVLDHGARHPDMKKRVEDAYILTCNVSLEYEKTPLQMEWRGGAACILDRFLKIINLFKHNKATYRSPLKHFQYFRLTLACGGVALNSFDDLNPDCLGHAGLVYEYTLGEEKFTFIEKCNNPRSVTLLVKGPNKHTLTQIKDAIRDGLRAVKNAIDDGCVVPGAGAVEVAMAEALIKYKPSVKGRAQLGVQAFADALLIIPKVLAQNSGFDLQETLVKVQAEHSESGQLVGVDLNTGEPMVAAEVGIWDNYCVKKQLLHSCTVIATNILLVDEIMRAGMSSLKG
uniref:Chaperonin containing TCP1 subunit 6A n=1 Tax=Panthera tigris altaica TaxID=74533 RepID=A0A8C9K4R2_PANTA